MEKYISEDYCSEEITGLLQDKGYIGSTNTYLNKDGFRVKKITLQSAMKWLREKHKIYIMIDRSFSMKNSWHYCICVNDDFDNLIQQEVLPNRKYEQACKTAIRYCLENLI